MRLIYFLSLKEIEKYLCSIKSIVLAKKKLLLWKNILMILELAKVENEFIPYIYWKKNNKYVKYKKEMLFYIYNFTIPYDNNFMERALKMIKSKTKISGGFRSDNRGLRFGNIMSIIKTSKLRNINLISSIINIINNFSLF